MDQAFPVAYIMMRRKTEAAYQSIYEYLREMCDTRATNIVTDYELALTNALGRVFNNVHLQKCWFHMVQALEENAKEFGIRRQVYRNDTFLHIMFRISKAIPNMVLEGWKIVKRKANQSPNQDVARRYVRYFETHWMERVGAANFTVFNSPRRTNNDQEVFHKLLNSYMDGNRPGIWHFTKTILKLDKHCEKFHVQQERHILRPRRRAYVQLDRNLLLATKKLQ